MAHAKGLCQCGCGAQTRLAPYTSVRLNWQKGRPIRFVNGHHKSGVATRFAAGLVPWNKGRTMPAGYLAPSKRPGVAAKISQRMVGNTNGRFRSTHGQTRNRQHSPEYRSWLAMKTRCSNPRRAVWKHYGGRGIAVCPEWRVSFAQFFADMGPKPSPAHSIDRINPNGHYEPCNCRWATQAEQMRNLRRHAALNGGSNGSA